MKVLSIGNFGTGWDGSICDEEHIAGALEGLGHEVIRIQREDVVEPLPIPYGSYDFALVAQWDGYPDILQLKPMVYWAFDYQADGQEWHERLVAESDLYLSKRIADSKYPNWQWLSQDFAPKFLDKYPLPIEKDIDVLFTGSHLPWATERTSTLRAVGKKFNLVIHSVNEWPADFKNVQTPIMDEGLPELYARAKVILSIDHTLEAGYWSDRNAQIMACGGFVLFRYIPLSETRFRDNVVYFYNVEDCLKQIDYYLTSETARIAIARNGYEYAHSNLFVYNRVQDLLTIVESIL